MASTSQISATEKFYEKSIITGSFFKPEHYLAFCDNDKRAQRLVDCCTNLGLMTFLNPPIDGICYENLISFWKNARFAPSTKKTEVDRIISNVFGKEVIVTPGVLHRYLNLPRTGAHDVKLVEVNIKKFWAEIAKNPKKTSKTHNLPRSMLALPFAEFAPVVTKNIEGRKGSMENLTEVRIKLMAIIYECIEFDWATFVFNRLKDQIQKEILLSKTAPGKGIQKKGEFWERKSYGFSLQHLFNLMKVKPTYLQTPHKSKVMFTYLKASMKPTPTVGRKRKQPELSEVGISSRTRSRSVAPAQSSQQTPSVVIMDDTESDEEETQKEEETQEEPVYLQEGEEGYRLTSSDEEDLSGQIDSYYPEEDQEKKELSDDELTIQEVLLRSLSKVDNQPSEQADQAHLPDPVNAPTIAQGGMSVEEEEEEKEEESEQMKEKEEEKEEKEEDDEKKKEEESTEGKEKDNDDAVEIAEEEKEEEDGEGQEERDVSSNEEGMFADGTDEMPIPDFDPESNFDLDTPPLIAYMEKQHSSRKHLKSVLRSAEASKENKFKALYDHLKVQDAIIDYQSQLLCNLQFLVPHLVQTSIFFMTDKVDKALQPVVRSLNAHTEHIQTSSHDLDLLLKIGAATNKILSKRFGSLPDVDNVQEEFEALFGDAKKGEESSGSGKKSKPEESSQKGKEPASSSRKEEEKGKKNKDKGKGIWIEEPEK